MNRREPPSQASAQADAHDAPSGMTVANFFSRIRVPMRMPATRLPPSLLNATVTRGVDSAATFVRNVSTSLCSKSPSMTISVDPPSTGFTSISAACAAVNDDSDRTRRDAQMRCMSGCDVSRGPNAIQI